MTSARSACVVGADDVTVSGSLLLPLVFRMSTLFHHSVCANTICAVRCLLRRHRSCLCAVHSGMSVYMMSCPCPGAAVILNLFLYR